MPLAKRVARCFPACGVRSYRYSPLSAGRFDATRGAWQRRYVPESQPYALRGLDEIAGAQAMEIVGPPSNRYL